MKCPGAFEARRCQSPSEKGHGRIESWAIAAFDICSDKARQRVSKAEGWAGSIAIAPATLAFGEGSRFRTRAEKRNQMPHPKLLLRGVRRHWEIESFHWGLDTVFAEDRCKISLGSAPEILSLMRRLAFNFVNPLRSMRGESMPHILLLMRGNPAFLEAVFEKGAGSIPPPMCWRKAGAEAGARNLSQNPLDWAAMGRAG